MAFFWKAGLVLGFLRYKLNGVDSYINKNIWMKAKHQKNIKVNV